MINVLLLGGGKIGRMIAALLKDSGDYRVTVGDVNRAARRRVEEVLALPTRHVDAADAADLRSALEGQDVVISALSFRFNPLVAQAALERGVSYFDLTEDVATTAAVRKIAEGAKRGQVFMPQCGLAPGFISIVAHDLAQGFDRVDRIHMRVGALPQFPTGELKYNLTWSTDGLINEYCNSCEAIQEGQRISALPLEGLEHFSLDGVRYEAFNTSGGLGTLCESWEGRVRELNYKTVRYQGHRHLMHFLLSELRLSDDRAALKDLLEKAIPITFQDVVVTFCTVAGWRRGDLVQVSDARKIYAGELVGQHWSAIQITTAAGVCTVIDLLAAGQLPQQGFVRQEEVRLDAFLANRFGKHYRSKISTRFSQSTLQDLGEDDDDDQL
jgi:saccharopine dehydrogenase-like NADP-dependent oxidoreductase